MLAIYKRRFSVIVLRFPLLLVTFLAFTSSIFSEISALVYSKEDASHEKNISKPRIYIENTGNEPISDFYYLYYFTTEDGLEPIIENYYTPNQSISLVHLGGDKYAVRYDCNGITLQPGEIFPGPDGNCVGIHYSNWEPLIKRNDRSNNFSKNFQPNEKIAVFLADQPKHRHHHKNKAKGEYENKKSGASVNVDIRVRK